MTDLTKPVRRRAPNTIRDGGKVRRLVVTLLPGGTVGLRPEGTRRTEYVSLDACYALAVRQRVIAEKSDKARARKARKGA